MIATNRDLRATTDEPVQLTAWAADGRKRVRELSPGDIVVIGSDSSCGLTLEGDGIASLHCMLKYADGQVRIQDWNSEGGTYIDGQRITEETAVPAGAEVRVGRFHIHLESHLAADGEEHGASSPATQSSRPAEPAPDVPDADEPATDPGGNPDPPSEELRQVEAENARLRAELEESRASESQAAPADWYESDPFQEETIELLRAEVEHLQQELAERDARLNELSQLAESSPDGESDAAAEPSAEMQRLVERLEQLLEELGRADERVAALEDLLHAADEANRAEQEERRQLEAWVNDIEERIGQREAEGKAECDVLRSRLEKAIADRNRAERALDEAGSQEPQSSSNEGLIESLRERITELEQKLDASLSERAELEKQAERNDPDRLQEQVDEAIRQERAELAQERAALARQRVELTRLREELEKTQQGICEGSDNIDNRIRVFREHLREIHQRDERERQQRGLASRLSRLWKRLEG